MACSCHGQALDSNVKTVTLKNSGNIKNDVPHNRGSSTEAGNGCDKSHAVLAITRK